MGKRNKVVKSGTVKPTAMMDELDVDFVSLVKQGANKQKFAMFKSDGSPEDEAKKKELEKNCAIDVCYSGSLGSSFSGAMEAIDTAEKLEESRDSIEESFFVLKMVIKGILDDNEITDKAKALKKAAGEFAGFVGDLFNNISVEKAAEILNLEEEMGTATATTTEVSKAGKDGGTSSNGQPEGKNRKAPNTKVKGISKQVTMLKSAIAKATADVEGLMATDFVGNQDKITKANENIEALETQLEEVEKAVGDRTDGAPATGEDTVVKNGDEAALGETHQDLATATDTGDVSGAVAKKKDEDKDGKGKKGEPFGGKKAPPFVKKEGEEEEVPVVKDTVGLETPTVESSQDVTGGVASVNEETGALNMQSFTSFMNKFEVSLDGKIKAQSDLIKEQGEKIEKLEKGSKAGTKRVDSLTKMAGLSNAQDLDFTVDTEEKVATQKSDDSEWSQVTSGNGSFKLNAAKD
ncbi:MAG: hypothetical protein V3T43_02800 [Nitrosomonadaceae bacterium]